MAAKISSAYAYAAYDLCLVSYSHLAQLDPRLKNSGQIFYQLPEIYPSVRCKIKQDFIVIKGIFRIDQLHLKSVFFYLFLADLKGVFFFLSVIGFNVLVFLGSHTYYWL